MSIQIDLWTLLGALIGWLLSFLAAVWGFARVLGGQVEKRLDERFLAQDKARETGAQQLRDSIDRYVAEAGKTSRQVEQLEKDFLNWKSELPLNYVRREDYIRGQTVIEAKQDALYSETRLVQNQLQLIRGKLEGNANG